MLFYLISENEFKVLECLKIIPPQQKLKERREGGVFNHRSIKDFIWFCCNTTWHIYIYKKIHHKSLHTNKIKILFLKNV